VANEQPDQSSKSSDAQAESGWWSKAKRRLTGPAAVTSAIVFGIGGAVGAYGDELAHVAARGQAQSPSAALVLDKGVDARSPAFARPVIAYPAPGFDFSDDQGNLYTCVPRASKASPSSVIRYFERKHETIRCYRIAHPEEPPHTHEEPAPPPPRGGATTQRFP
jgi:hypothetical protein